MTSVAVSVPCLILLLTGLGFIGLGAAYLLKPTRMAALTDLTLATPTARADFAAIYGGFELGFGIFLLACTRHPGWLEPGLWAATAALAGFASARGGVVLASGGRVRGSIWFALVLELLGVALNGWAVAQVSRGG